MSAHPDIHDAAADREQRFLAELGTTVRGLRNAQGLSRRSLALAADVSERYLAQLEAGRGNISVLLLRRIAVALNLDMAALLLQGPGASELRDILAALPHSPGSVREQALRSALTHLNAPHARATGVALLGLRGAGKSTLGRRAARELGLPFVELDQRIAETSGLSVPEIFNLYGEDGFRALERRCLEEIIESGQPIVLATGGGIVAASDTLERLLERFFTVWVRAAAEEHMQRVRAQGDMRPMAGSDDAMDALRAILTRRHPLYARADRQLDTSARSVENCARDLVTMLREADFQNLGSA